MQPVIILNFKNYRQVAGERGILLATEAVELANKTNTQIFIAPQLIDTSLFSAKGLKVFAQHADSVSNERSTGKVTLSNLKQAGVVGTLVNHSEYPQSAQDVREIVEGAARLGIKTCVCTPDLDTLSILEGLEPDFVAYEPPELIGGNISVSKARPEILTRFFGLLDNFSPSSIKLCGAGIKTSEDVKAAKLLGAQGVLISSGVVLAETPSSALLSVIDGFF
jgi:triosephosphate isomerase